MGALSSHEVTGLLQAWGRGDEGALQKLVPLVYEQLHAAARRYMAGERRGHTLQTTASSTRLIFDWLMSGRSNGKIGRISWQFVRS